MTSARVPGTAFTMEVDETLTARLRADIQLGGHGLYVFRLPFQLAGTPLYTIAEAYTPEGLRSATWDQLDPFRRADWQDGKLVAITTLPLQGTFQVGRGVGAVHAFLKLTDAMLLEIRRNNRNARSELRRSYAPGYFKQEHADVKAAEEQPIFDEWAEFYEWAYKETQEFAMGKPRVSVL